MIPCFVLDGKVLGCIYPNGQFQVLGLSIGVSLVTQYIVQLDRSSSLKPATQYDFDHFRVDSKYYFVF